MSTRRVLPILLLLFVGSGCTALIYEVVWFQLLQLVIGVSAVSMAVLLGTFMAGLFLGSLVFPRLVPVTRHPLRVYAVLEAAIGLCGLLVLVAVPAIGAVYAAWAGPGITGLALRALAAAICLLPPTVAMGATLPALARWVKTTPDGVAWLGFFYAGNTVGAVLGCLLAGFYLLRFHDLATSTFVAVALNALVAATSLWVARRAPYAAAPAEPANAPVEGADAILATTFVSGATALAAEVVWTRTLSLLIGGTTYTFSLVLAAFLVGIGLGSAAGSAIGRAVTRPRAALAVCQALLVAAIAWGAWMLGASLPWWPVDPSLSRSPWFNFQLDMLRALVAVLPATLLWGASFPLALAALAAEGRDPAALVGRVYAANTVGAIVGSLGASLLLVPAMGTQHTQQLLLLLAAGSALFVLAPPAGAAVSERDTRRFAIAALVVLGACGLLMARAVPPLPGQLVAYGRFCARQAVPDEVLYVGEGLSASVAVTRVAGDVLAYHNSGKVQASTALGDMRFQRMLGHFTTLMAERPRSVFVIGCGAGVTAGAVSLDPAVERLTIVEIEPLVVRSVGRYFGRHNANVLANPKTHVHVDDARHYLQTTHETFDAITADPLDPWVKGAAMLYTSEFFELVNRRLNPGGTVTLFVQLYQCSEAAVKSEIATFMRAFPNGVVFATTVDGVNVDLVLAARKGPLQIDVDAWDSKLRRPEYAPMARSLREVGFDSASQLVSTYAGRGSDLGEWLRDAEINRDRDLRLQYIAGMGLNLRQGRAIYDGMLRHRREPVGLFTSRGTPAP